MSASEETSSFFVFFLLSEAVITFLGQESDKMMSQQLLIQF